MLTLLICLSAFVGVQALEVSNGSSCADICEGPTLTFGTDLTCMDNGYSSTDKGTLMKSCLECESKSNYVDSSVDAPQDNDQYWGLFNMKYTLQYCLTQTTDGTPNFSECESKCEGLFSAITPSWFSNPRPAQYDYCTIQDNAFTDHADECAACLQSASGSVVLGNFLNAMKSGCDSRADAHSGNTIPLQRELFNTETITSSSGQVSTSSASPTTSATATDFTASASSGPESTSANSSSAPTSTSESAITPETSSTSSTGLSSGAAAGIGVGCGLGALALGIGILWYLRRRRNTVRVPRSMFDQPAAQPYYDSKNTYDQVSSNQAPLQPTPPVETYGHERYEMGHGDSMKSETTITSELDGRSVPRQTVESRF